MDLSIVAIAGAFVIFGVARVFYADFLSREARVKRRLAGRARVSIGEAQEGLVRLTGRTQPIGELLRAPVSQRPCLAFQVVIEKRQRNAAWETMLELADARPFLLADESGTALIDTAAGPYSLALVPDRRRSSPLLRSSDEELRRARELLESANIATATIFGFSKGVRFSEATLLAERPVSVGGRCAREVTVEGEQAGYRAPPERLVVRGTGDEPLLISNWRQAL